METSKNRTSANYTFLECGLLLVDSDCKFTMVLEYVDRTHSQVDYQFVGLGLPLADVEQQFSKQIIKFFDCGPPIG